MNKCTFSVNADAPLCNHCNIIMLSHYLVSITLMLVSKRNRSLTVPSVLSMSLLCRPL